MIRQSRSTERFWQRWRVVVLASLSWSVVAVCGESFGQGAPLAAPARRILFLGNSITLHGPAPAIGWSGNWGMAASALEKDYVHLTSNALAKAWGAAPEIMVKNIAEFERKFAAYDAAEKLRDAIAFRPDIIVVAIGENAPKLAAKEEQTQFQQCLVKLLRAVQGERRPAIVVRSCFWPSPAKDQALKLACVEVGGTFIDIGGLSKNEANFARAEREFKHKGVAGHPGAKGMQAIADAIVPAVKLAQETEKRK